MPTVTEEQYRQGKKLGLSRDQVEAMASIAQDRYGEAMPSLLRIFDKERKLVAFKPTKAHIKLARNKRRFNFWVKPRQVFATSFKLADTFLDCTTGNGKKALFINLDSRVTNDVFGRCKDFIAHHQFPSIMPAVKSESAARIEWVNGATFDAQTVNNEGGPGYASRIGRSCTVQEIHVTEAAYMNHYREFMNGLEESLPRPFGSATIESTGNGAQGGFWEDCTEIFTKGKEVEPNVWVLGEKCLVFIAWWEHDEYTSPDDPLDNFSDQFDENHWRLWRESERDHRGEMDKDPRLSDEFKEHAMNWRRIKLLSKGFLRSPEQAVAIMDQEYPATLRHAFQASGSAYFSLSHTDDMAEAARKYNADKRLPLACDIVTIKGEPAIIPSRDGGCLMWDAPYDPMVEKWENRYVIGSDVGGGNTDSDPDVIWVKDRLYNRYVFICHDRLGPQEHARKIIDIAKCYHNAHLAFECNNHGAGVQIKVWEFGYPFVFKHDESASRYQGLGFHTNDQTRNTGLNHLKQMYEDRQRPLLIHYEDFFNECRTFRSHPGRTPTGQPKKPVAAPGKHDDLIMAMMICEAYDAILPPCQRVQTDVTYSEDQVGFFKSLAMSPRQGGLTNVL
jgi:hypothetical protein